MNHIAISKSYLFGVISLNSLGEMELNLNDRAQMYYGSNHLLFSSLKMIYTGSNSI